MATFFNNTENPDTINKNSFGAKRTALYSDDGNMVVLFDAVLTETANYTSKISEHPAEDGAAFSDMQTVDPVTVTLSVIRSNNPIDTLELDDFTQLGAGLAAGLLAGSLKDTSAEGIVTQNRGAAVGTALAVITDFLKDSGGRNDIDAFNAIRQSQINSTRLILVTPFQSYSNMLLKDIIVTKDNKSTTALVANLVFRQVLIYKSESAEIETRGVTQKDDDESKTKKNQGFKNPTASTDAQIEKVKGKSLLKAISDVLFPEESI